MIGKNLSLNKESPIEKDIYKVRDSDPTDLYDAINKNDNLDEKEKRLIDNSWIFINDYYQYIDSLHSQIYRLFHTNLLFYFYSNYLMSDYSQYFRSRSDTHLKLVAPLSDF